MTRLDDYRSALLAAFPDVSGAELERALAQRGPGFASFIIDHGLGPLWHERTGRSEFHQSRMSAEAYFAAQEVALREIDALCEAAGIEYAVIKGAATRLLVYDNPALRACHDIDLLVRSCDRVRAASILVGSGYRASPEANSISRELMLSKGVVNVDLHWGLLREGRLRNEPAADMLARRRRQRDLWMLNSEDASFVLLVHPAFAKHLAGWEMGLHRVADLVMWLGGQGCDWPTIREQLQEDGVSAAAWATLRWVELLTRPSTPAGLTEMLSDISPGRVRRAWLNRWLAHDLSERASSAHSARLIGFSPFLHDTVGDAARAFAGRFRAKRRQQADLAAFEELLGQ